MSERKEFTPEECALEAIMKGVLRHWPSDVEPDGTNASVVITLAQAKLIRVMLRDRVEARYWTSWNLLNGPVPHQLQGAKTHG